MGLAEAFIRTCKQRKRGSKIADSTGLNLSGGELLMRSLILRRLLLRHVLTVTGDTALIDEDGFIRITGRQSRFSKIGGEMIPHISVEETLARILGVREDEPLQVAVTAVPDERKGERLVVLHTQIGKTPDELRKGLAEAGLPNLYIPSTDSFHEVAVIPILGSGKVDLKEIKSIAGQVFGEPK